MKLGEEYERWAETRARKKLAEKPRIKVVGRLRGRRWWQCSGGLQYDGYGHTPAEAYRKWRNEISF